MMLPPPNTLQPAEELGRAVFDSKHVKAANRGVIPPKVFLEKPGLNELSVDRLAYADLRKVAEAQTRLRGRECRGWASLSLEAAAAGGREVRPDPIPPDQLYHAYILLPFVPPLEAEEAFIIQNKHAVELAMSALWRPAPPRSDRPSDAGPTKPSE